MTLIEQLEKLEKPCRECDALIWLTMNRPNWREEKAWKKTNGWASEDRPSSMVSYYTPDGLGGSHTAQPYTASIDAAMALVPEGHAAAIGTMFGMPQLPWACVWTPQGEPKYRGDASTAAIALCIAALKAKQ